MKLKSEVRTDIRGHFFVVDTQAGAKRLQIGLVGQGTASTEGHVLACIDEIRKIDRYRGPALDVRIVEINEAAAAKSTIQRVVEQSNAGQVIVLWYRDEATFIEAINTLGLKWQH